MAYFNQKKYSDILLILDDGSTTVRIYAHRQILVNKSVFFDRLFDFHPEQREFVLSIGEYQISVNEALQIIEDNIYRGLPVSFEQIQNYSHFLNYLLIDGKTYNREFMTSTRFIIQACSASKKSITLLDITHKIGTLTFETDPANKRLLLIVDKYLVRNDEFLDYLLMLTNDINEEQITKIRDEGLVLDNTNEIQNLIKGLYTLNLIVDNGHTYSNILAKSLFDQHFGVVDPIYRRTQELSDIKLYTINTSTSRHFGFRFSGPTSLYEPFLNINIGIEKTESSISYVGIKVIINEHPKFLLVEEWLKIFTPLNPIDNTTKPLAFNPTTLVMFRHSNNKDLAAISAIVSYIYVANLYPTINTLAYPEAAAQLTGLKQLIGLDINNEFSMQLQ